MRSRTEEAIELDRPSPGPPAREPSLAVLPFDDLSGAAEYLANGISEDILTALTRLRGFRVTSRTSVRQWAGQDRPAVSAIRELLGVDYVLEGSVQVHRERVRITAQLIDTAKDTQVWAQAYDRELADVFRVQSDVALRVARALEAALSPGEHDRLRRPPTHSTEAWKLYLRGREILQDRDPEQTARAVTLFEEALVADPDFGQAWVGLADAHLVRAGSGAASVAEVASIVEQAIQRALETDPELGEAHATLGLLRTFVEPDLDAARRHYRRAVERSPGYATAHQWFGNFLCLTGEEEEGLRALRLAVELDPLAPAVRDSLGLGLYHVGRVEEAESQFQRTLALDPGFSRSHVSLSLCAAARGALDTAATHLCMALDAGVYGTTPAEAAAARQRLPEGPSGAIEEALDAARRKASRVPLAGVLEAVLLIMLGRPQEALDALETTGQRGAIGFGMMYAPALDPLAVHERFTSLMDRAGLLLPRWRS